MMNLNGCSLKTLAIVVACLAWPLASSFGQRDNVFLVKNPDQRGASRVTGEITKLSPDFVDVKVGDRTRNIPVHTIRKVVFSGEPSALDRARGRYADGRFSDCLSELDKIKEAPSSTPMQQEIAFYRAAANAQIALRGGQTTAQVAGVQINNYLKDFPSSHHFYDATGMKARLLLAIGQPGLAENEFRKITGAKSPETMLLGLFQLGSVQLMLGKSDAARTSFQKLDRVDSNSPQSRQYKLAGKCQLAKIKASTDPSSAIKELEAIIKAEPEENSLVMAHAYNALGACYQSQGDTKAAVLAYLHNDLLFDSEDDARAEALFHLATLFVDVNDPDSANAARQKLLSRYQNTVWAGKLGISK